MATILAAFRDGWARVWRAPAILLGVFFLTLAAVVPFGLVLEERIAAGLGNSMDAQTMASGVNIDWWDRFAEGATGLDRTFTTAVIGFGAVLDNLSRFVDNGPTPPSLIGLVAASLLVWLFLIGGILDRYARMRAVRAKGFFSACGVYFPRFLRLAIIAGLGYLLLFGVLHAWFFDSVFGWDGLYRQATHDLTVERTAFFIRLALYLVFLAILAFWNLVMDYAKIRAVVEDRRSMLGAALAAWRFVVGHPLKTGGLYLINVLAFVAVVGVYGLVAPGASGFGRAAWLGFLIGQAYLLTRLAVKLAFYASQIALFQRSLAHAGYTAAPEPVWPDSPAAETIANAAPTGGPSA
jgi:hypothetical protein